jgi:glycosyltransferase involved in cell wall biosynthesis
MEEVRKLLVIANLAHASPRIPNLLTPLAEEGWDIKVVTPRMSEADEASLGLPKGFKKNVRIVYTPAYKDVYQPIRNFFYLIGLVPAGARSGFTNALKEVKVVESFQVRLIDQLLRVYQSLFAFPDTERAWRSVAQPIVEKILEDNPNTIIVSSSPYPTSHFIAKHVCIKYEAKWIADFRDPWSNNHNYNLPKWRKYIDQFLEKRTLKPASVITTVTPSIAKKMKLIHKQDVRVIANGYQSDVKISKGTYKNKRFDILYSGAIYPEYQHVELILEALKIIKDKQTVEIECFRLRFCGNFSNELQQKIGALGLAPYVEQMGLLSRAETRRLQSRAMLLLVMQWESQEGDDIIPLKFLEYLCARRPILATGGSEKTEIANILNITKAGVVFHDPSDIASYLLNMNEKFKRQGWIKFDGNEKEIRSFSYEERSRELGSVCDEINRLTRHQGTTT